MNSKLRVLLEQGPHAIRSVSHVPVMKMHEACLNMATLLQKAPSKNAVESGGAPDESKVNGNSGSKIVFSWTWNENRKKDIELFRSACKSTGRITGDT